MIALDMQESQVDPKTSPITQIKLFRKAHHLTYPILSDDPGKIITKFGFDGIPSNVVLDRQGRYVANPDDADGIKAVLKKLVH